MTLEVEHLPSKHDILISDYSTAKKKARERKPEERSTKQKQDFIS
jgi:hypothetical protein